MSHVLITGGTGVLGKRVSTQFEELGIGYTILTRNKELAKEDNFSFWDIDSNIIDDSVLLKTTDIIHLAGENIFNAKWNDKGKESVLKSRIGTAKFLLDSLNRLNHKLNSFISASAVGVYSSVRDSKEELIEDTHYSTVDFFSEVCNKWEKLSDKFNLVSNRVLKLRIGFVLYSDSKSFLQMIKPIYFGIKPTLGRGDQILPWTHIDDITGIIVFSLRNEHVKGAINMNSPHKITQLELMNSVEKTLNKKTFNIKIPASLIRFFASEKANFLIDGLNLSSNKIKSLGYEFKYADIDDAMKDLIKK